ncbi:flagellar basal-body MS-ring/collar protein FliF [Microbacterium sp. NPDC090007]|uniref:flagellar basal-body MS-ring/collar protein FliF n=1 Tax=Microbacterium sp. NPDC090007 TaxID=3364204 RepID=UPI0038066665
MTSLLERTKRVVGGFSVAQRTIAVIGAALLVMGAIALGSWLTKPQMSPLFTGLSAPDASAVVEQLKSAGVAYELTEGGATVLVPDAEVYPQRLAAAAAGLPSDTTGGYTLLDKMGVTASEFQQSVTYKRAIEGELARTIGAMAGVTAASVQLAIPEESVFVAEARHPTASVFVKTQGGATLTEDQVAAIVHLTSAAIPGMTPEDVAVTDQAGKVLAAVGTGLTGSAGSQANEYEAKVAASVTSMLERIVGPGNATVSVSADLATSTSERMDETYTAPEGGVSTSEQTKTEKSTGGEGQGAGVLGPDNIAVPGAGGAATVETSEATRSNAVNKSTEKTTTPAGRLTRQTISIALDRAAVTGVTAQQVQALVSDAAGVDAARGDAVTVEFVEFSQSGADAAAAALQAAEAEQARQAQAEILRSGIIGASIVLAALILVIALLIRRRMKRRTLYTEEGPIEYLSTLTETEEQKLKTLKGLADPIALPAAPPTRVLPTLLDVEEQPETPQVLVERHRRDVEQLARADPSTAAQALARMMDEALA